MSDHIEGVPEGWRLIRITNIPKIGEYALSCAGRVVRVSDPDEWDIACIVERIEPPKLKYRPFANSADFAPHRDRWCIIGVALCRVVRYDDDYVCFDVGCMSWHRAFEVVTFEGGDVFGVEAV